SSLIDALKEDHLGSAPGSSSIDALKEDHLGSAPGSSSIDALKEDHLGSAPGSSLIDALKEDHFAFAPGSFLIDALKEDELGSAPALSWRRLEEDYGEGNGADGDESLDSGSDGAESSSPDASMADIMPMLDELHPLLQLEAPRPACGSHDGSDAGSERLHKSDDESLDSEEDTDNQGESVDSEEDTDNQGEGEDDNDDDEEEGVTTKGEKEDESKSVIKWTEVDQKNLMDLGTSELERNQRLENLIARRRARKIMRLMAEKNLIDLESSDLLLVFHQLQQQGGTLLNFLMIPMMIWPFLDLHLLFCCQVGTLLIFPMTQMKKNLISRETVSSKSSQRCNKRNRYTGEMKPSA
ncbi:hypothetical protein CISIN_1g0479991mg, partial [Citrus sinensis]